MTDIRFVVSSPGSRNLSFESGGMDNDESVKYLLHPRSTKA